MKAPPALRLCLRTLREAKPTFNAASYTMPRNTLAILKTHLEPPCPNYPPTWGSVTNSHVCGPADSVLTFTLPISGCSNLLTTHQGAGSHHCNDRMRPRPR